jgi:hypothetical protein
MKPRFYKTNRLIKFVFSEHLPGISLAPFGIFLREDLLADANKYLLNHEKIHWKQQIEMLFLFFYIFYLTEWLIRLFTNPGNAYRSISFEREAYDHSYDLYYPENRKPYSWVRRIRK